MRERWPKPRRESGPNQRWLRSSSAARRGPSAIAGLPPRVRHRRQSGTFVGRRAVRGAPPRGGPLRSETCATSRPAARRRRSASATPCSRGSRSTAGSTSRSSGRRSRVSSPASPTRASPPASSARSRAASSQPALLERLCDEAYTGFRHPAICPLVQLDADEWLLELFHGPTLAFKDLALQLVGRLFDHVLTQRDERITVLVATSGDTGSAAISGLASCSSRRGRRALPRRPREPRAAPADDDRRRAERARGRRRRHVRRLPGHRQAALRRGGVPRSRRSCGRELDQLGARRGAGRLLRVGDARARRARARVRGADGQLRQRALGLGGARLGPAARAARDRLERQRHPPAPARDRPHGGARRRAARSARAWTSRSPPTSSGCSSSSTTATPSAPRASSAAFARDGLADPRRRAARGAARAVRGDRVRRPRDARGDAPANTTAAAHCSIPTRPSGWPPAGPAAAGATRRSSRSRRRIPPSSRPPWSARRASRRRSRRRSPTCTSAASGSSTSQPTRAPCSASSSASRSARRAARRAQPPARRGRRRPTAPAGAAGRARRTPCRVPKTTPTAQKPAPESRTPAEIDATAAHPRHHEVVARREHAALARRGDVGEHGRPGHEARRPAETEQEEERRDQRRGARHGAAEGADGAGGEAEQARAAPADAVGEHPDGIGQREHADEVRGHQQLHLPSGPAAVGELDRGDRHDPDHRGLRERGRDDRRARRGEAHQLAARPRRRRLRDGRELAVPAA